MNFKDSFHPYAAVTILFWSLAYVLTRLALNYFSPFSLGFLRYLLASFLVYRESSGLFNGRPYWLNLPAWRS
ncbi:MAG: hypothetical protein ACOX7I_02935 [Oscillospiraceae bacterium]|jgi:drug/metabolite transporter (DMT)-like permease